MFVAGCTYVSISGDSNELNLDTAGTAVDTHTAVDDDSDTRVERK